MSSIRQIAYFSMEIGFHPDIPTYSGGLGVLAGDTVQAAADLQVPMVAVTLLHRKGYFRQLLYPDGTQAEEPVAWPVEAHLTHCGITTTVTLEGRTVFVTAWRYDVTGEGGFTVPIFLLDTDLPANQDADRMLTDHLYGGDTEYRLGQEILLGIGGVRILRALGFRQIQRFHMNEGHAALLTVELLREQAEDAGRSAVVAADLEAVRNRCVFTTHTPVDAGHDRFPLELVDRLLGNRESWGLGDWMARENRLNMTYLALYMSRYVNGVAKKHGETSRHMFAEYTIDSITNGVHPARWASPPFADLFDRHFPGWRGDNYSLRYALNLPNDELWAAHVRAKRQLLEFVRRQTGVEYGEDVLTIVFARRATAYKRADLIFDDTDRLRRIARVAGPVQIVFAGKAHPRDEQGKRLIQRVVRMAEELRGEVPIVYLADYDMRMAGLLTAGADLWLNTPQPPSEASGTSGMKAALNGVPSLSILDGWWLEGCIEGLTGWAIGNGGGPADRPHDAQSLYEKLETVILPMFYGQRTRYLQVMRYAIALNGSFFNTQRMVQQYAQKAYL
jgi:glycogen phosphorylase